MRPTPAHAPSNNAFKLTSASRVEALRATTRRLRSQLNAMLSGPVSTFVERAAASPLMSAPSTVRAARLRPWLPAP
jgi:hypothetical protein